MSGGGNGIRSGNGNGNGNGNGGRDPWTNTRLIGTVTGTETETRAVVKTGTRTVKGTRMGSGRAEERRRSATTRTRIVDAMWEMGEIWVKRKKNRRQESVGSAAANPDNLENIKEAGREAQGTRG